MNGQGWPKITRQFVWSNEQVLREFLRLSIVASRLRPIVNSDSGSDHATVSLADDATYAHMRGLYPSPETLEGR